MPVKLFTTLKKFELVSPPNQILLKEFYQYQISKDLKSDRHIISLLTLLISFDKFYHIPFTSIDRKEQILKFLNHQYLPKEGKWVEREKDADGKYISTFNHYLSMLSVFFRWLTNRSKSEEENWETPTFLKINTKKPLRDSPYGINDIWDLDDLLTVVSYEPELRNQAIVTLLWDLDARSHEVTALRIKDIILNEQYGEGTIPSNTKTGGGPLILTSSFTYVRDWINKHPFKNEPNARLICNLRTGAPIQSEAIYKVLDRLRRYIKRLVESGAIADEQKRQKLEYLLRVKKWNPYCFRHSAITDDSDHLPEYAVKKKARWVMGSKQASRYIKNRMGDELKNKILEHSGIKLVTAKVVSVQRTCGRCNHVNKLESKYCERVGCNYPLTQLALDEIKAAEKAKIEELVKVEMQEKDYEVQQLNERIDKISQVAESKYKSYDDLVKKAEEKLDVYRKQQEEIDERRHLLFDERRKVLEDLLDKELPGWEKRYHELLVPRPLTKKELQRLEGFLEQIKNIPDSDSYDDD